MPFILILITSIIIGVFAQTKKGRTGAGWGFLTFVTICLVWLFLYFCVSAADPRFMLQPYSWFALTIMTCLLVGVVLAIIVATLPRRVPAVVAAQAPAAGAPAKEAMKKCPQCAELVKAEAKICRFCRYEFPATLPEAPEPLPEADSPWPKHCLTCLVADRGDQYRPHLEVRSLRREVSCAVPRGELIGERVPDTIYSITL